MNANFIASMLTNRLTSSRRRACTFKRRAQTKRTWAAAEVLEIRQVPAATAVLQTGVLTITGSEQADNIVVIKTGSNLNVKGVTTTFAARDVTSIIVNAGRGNDTVDLTGVTLPTKVFGGAGNDSLTGGSGNDTMFGEAGNDVLRGNLGNDSLNGGAGFDRLYEVANADFVLTNSQLAGSGTDTLSSLESASLTSSSGRNPVDTTRFTGEVTLSTTSATVGTSTQVTTSQTALAATAPVALFAPLSDTFALHSRPSATKTIYLDFDGHTTANTEWNRQFTNGQAFTQTAYSFEGGDEFSNNELSQIQRIWQRVVEDFAPFDVDVTTQQPSLDDLRNTGGSDSRWGIRVVIGSTFAPFAQTGGVAYLGSFTWNTDTPALVFEDNLGDGDDKAVAEAISHEVGHTLGLDHDGRTVPAEEYYEGHNNWAPIMGTSYFQEVTQWSRGEYLNASNTEDDLAIITTSNGFGYRLDDAVNSAVNALEIGGVTANGVRQVDQSGVISTDADSDWFKIVTTGTGSVSLAVRGGPVDSNLNIKADLYNANGQLVVTSNPNGDLTARIEQIVAAGTYFLKIDGVGEGDPQGLGYSDYGSLGQYQITGSFLSGTTPPPVHVSVNDVRITEANPGSANALFTISLSNAATGPVQINYVTADGTAVSGRDYVATQGSVIFQPGETTKTVSVTVLSDLEIEANEMFFLRLSTSQATLSDAEGQALIVDNSPPSPPVRVSVNDVQVTEVNQGSVNAVFTITLSSAARGSVQVNYTTDSSTANSRIDYIAKTGFVVFQPGETSKTVNVAVLGDTEIEANEVFYLRLSSTQVTLGDAEGQALIINDDVPPPLVRVSVNDVQVIEGNRGTVNAVFTITLSSAATGSVRVNFTTDSATANSRIDYIANTGFVVFQPGETSKTVSVAVLGDTEVEANEVFYLRLSTSQATLGDAEGQALIINDDKRR